MMCETSRSKNLRIPIGLIYKSSLVSGKSFTDLTGGSGLDSAVILDKFETARIIDLSPDNAAIIAHNIALLSDKNVTVENTSAEAFIQTMQPTDLALIDPQRRENKSGKRGLYKFEDCSSKIQASMFAMFTSLNGRAIVKSFSLFSRQTKKPRHKSLP